MKESSLSDAIKKLSSKRNVLSEEAKAAKEYFDQEKDSQEHEPFSHKISDKQAALINEFEESIKLLSLIFRKSRFDELVLFISNSKRMMLINLFIGFMRGIGWILGVFLVLFIFFIFVKGYLSCEFIEKIQDLFLR